MLPINHKVFPIANPSIAEVYGASALAASLYIMYLQITWHTAPIYSGFHDAYISKGGFKIGYQLVKYAKAVLTNMILCSVILILLFSQGFQSRGIAPVMALWSFVNPLMIYAYGNLFVLRTKVSPAYVKILISWIGLIVAVFALTIAGTVAFANSTQGGLKSLLNWMLIFPPTVLVTALEYGFLYKLDMVLKHQDETSVELDPYKNRS